MAILLPGLAAGGLGLRLAWNPADRRLGEVIRLLLPNGLAVGVIYAGSIADTAFASMAPETAGLPALHNAWLLVGLPIALLGQAVGQSAFPRLASYAAGAKWDAFRRTALCSLAAAIALSIPAVLGLVILGRLTIRVLFEHGRYDTEAGTLTYAVLGAYALGLPAYVASEILGRGLIALRDTRTPLLTNTGQVLGRIAIMVILVGRLGVLAVPSAFAATGALESVVLAVILLVKLHRRHSRAAGVGWRLTKTPPASA